MNFLNGFYLCLRGNELFFEFVFESCPCAVIDGGSSQRRGQAVAGPISGWCSHLEVGKGGCNFPSFVGIYRIIDGVIILEGILDRFGFRWVSIEGIYSASKN